jgi:hypothetical protein
MGIIEFLMKMANVILVKLQIALKATIFLAHLNVYAMFVKKIILLMKLGDAQNVMIHIILTMDIAIIAQ